jgi:hypothetical protein
MNRLTALLLLCACLVLPAFAEVRLALVIDQTNYQHTSELSRIALASSEADQVEAALKDTGFKVTRHRDLTSTGLRDALDAFRLSLENAGPEAVGFLYYTGHGAQHPQTRNSFLLGTEARLRGASDLAAYGVPLETQKDAFAATGVKAIIMVFDACRNVAAGGGYKSGVKGFGWLEATADMLIAYSTGLNDVASEGVYAPVLAEEIRRQGQTAETLFANVQRKVAAKTGREQLPWYNTQLYNSVCLAGCEAPSSELSASAITTSPAPAIASGPSDAELSRARVFCDGLRQASDAVIAGKRPGFKLRSGEDSWDGDVPGYRLRLGELIAQGRYTYLMQQYELWFFLSGASTGEIRETLNLCPAVARNVSGNAGDGVLFSGMSSGVQRDVQIHVSAVDRQYNETSRGFESGVSISLELVPGQ